MIIKPFFLNNLAFFLFLILVMKNVFLFFIKLFIKRFFFNFKLRSIINKSGFRLLKPFILQLRRELSLLIDLDVEKIQSFLDLNKCVTFCDNLLVIHLDFLLIEK